MVPPTKRTPDEAWDALEKMAQDDEVERVLGLSDEQIDAELAAAGVDPTRVRERGRAIGEKVAGEGSGPPPARVVLFRRARWGVLVAAALAAIAAPMMGGSLVGRGHPDDEAANREEAAALRAKASTECAAARWQACLDGLNVAKALDPAAEEERAAIRKWRLTAEAALRGQDAGR